MSRAASAGLLLFRLRRCARGRVLQVLLGHPGGPFWAHRDEGAWSIPKGEYEPTEDPLAAARREFEEELGVPVPASRFLELGAARQPSGKTVVVWAAEGDLDPVTAVSNIVELEWPQGSGRLRRFPELDRVAWFDLAAARRKLLAGQRPFLDRLVVRVRAEAPELREG